MYWHRLAYAEMSVDRSRYRGTCYQTSNRAYLGQTRGRGKDDKTREVNRLLKDVFGYALVKESERYHSTYHDRQARMQRSLAEVPVAFGNNRALLAAAVS